MLLCVFFNFINLQINRTYIRIKEMKLRNAIGASKRNDQPAITGIFIDDIYSYFICLEFNGNYISPVQVYIFHTTIDSKELYVDMIKISLFSWIITLSISLPISFRFIQAISQLLVSGGVAPHRKSGFRKIAMTIQLGICVFFLLMCAFILLKQTSLMKNKNLGFEKKA